MKDGCGTETQGKEIRIFIEKIRVPAIRLSSLKYKCACTRLHRYATKLTLDVIVGTQTAYRSRVPDPRFSEVV